MKRYMIIGLNWACMLGLSGLFLTRAFNGGERTTTGRAAQNEPLALIDEDFRNGLGKWTQWQGQHVTGGFIEVHHENDSSYVRISNPGGGLIGIQHLAQVESGTIYRLRASARSVATNASEMLFGGRVAVYLPPQPEQQLIWMSEYNRWWQKELVFTNQVTGTAVVYVHLGYGNVATTGEFTGIRLERVGQRVVE